MTTVDIPWPDGLSAPLSGLLGAVVMGVVAILCWLVMMAILSTFFPKAEDFLSLARKFYFALVTPVWAIIGGFLGYYLLGVQ